MTGIAHPASAPRSIQNRAVLANAGIVLLSVTTGGLSADLLQLYAAQVLHLSARQVGVTLGLLVLSVPAQLVAAARARRLTPRQMMTWGYAAILGCLALFPLVLPLLQVNRTAGFALFMIVVLAVETAISCSWAIVWWAWMQDLVRAPERGRFLGRMRLITQSVSAIALLTVGLLLRSRITYGGYNLLLAVLAGYVMLAIWQFQRIPDMPRPAAARPGGDRRQLAADLAGLRRHRGVRTLLLVMLAMQLLSAPLLSTYLLEVIRLSPGRISGLLAVRTIVGVLTIRRWGAVIDRHGAKRVQVWTALATGLTSLLWLAVRPAGAGGDLLARLCGWPLVLLIGTAVAAAASGLSLAFLVDVQDQVPAPLAPVAFAVQDIISSSQAQMAFLLAGVLVTAAGCNATLACTTGVLDPYRALLVLAAPAAIAIAWLQRRALRGAPVDMPAAQHTTGGAAQPRQGG